MSATAQISEKPVRMTKVVEWGVFGFGFVSLALAIAMTVFAPDLPAAQNTAAAIDNGLTVERVNL
ncbi:MULTISPECIES: hypothetical protein [Halocynthiibacter]|uniref:Uncharacterized protein n=1 Tax=Halocynthiibacter halioticoli TaxID=2986804 RepID=A0AAE3IX63_9RHOB|nr:MULTISPECIES: hypothetical protein [Halocynthiibacter]MCV6823728.1 hypothetical protein [Halocynthiibacter halioticoli]MCW4056729.1 hypothetical protein [Halocynthiibacter sp. SDUM655004]